MTKEQEKAIEYLTKDLKKADMLKMTVHTDNESVRVILDLVKQQQEENKQKDKVMIEMAKKIYKNVDMYEMADMARQIDYSLQKLFSGIPDEEVCEIIEQYYEKKVSEEDANRK